MTSELHLRIVTPDRTIIDRKVAEVSFEGVDGGYGILPHHAPMMTAVSQTGVVRIKELDGTTLELFASDGFAQMHHNVLTLVCEAGEFANEIDLDRVKDAEAKAREKLAGLDRLSTAFIKAEASLKKALAREMVARRQSGTGKLS